jgi:hypothetical protein
MWRSCELTVPCKQRQLRTIDGYASLSSMRLRSVAKLVLGCHEWHETVDPVRFTIEDGPTQHCMSGGILNRIDFGLGDLNPHTGVVPIFGDPMLHPGASCCLECFVILMGQDRLPQRVAEPLTCHLCLIVLCMLVPSGFDEAAIRNCAAHRVWRAGHGESPKPVLESAVGVRGLGSASGYAYAKRRHEPYQTHCNPSLTAVLSCENWLFGSTVAEPSTIIAGTPENEMKSERNHMKSAAIAHLTFAGIAGPQRLHQLATWREVPDGRNPA